MNIPIKSSKASPEQMTCTTCTHNFDRYAFISMFNTLVDCLGLSVIHSYSQYCSEHSEHLMKALRLFMLDQEDQTFMTDDGPVYHIVAAHFKKNHLLCTKHYHNNVFGDKAGLGHLAAEFEVDMFKAIYADFGSVGELNTHLTMCSDKYGFAKSANKFTKALIKDQRLVCRTHTRCFFLGRMQVVAARRRHKL